MFYSDYAVVTPARTQSAVEYQSDRYFSQHCDALSKYARRQVQEAARSERVIAAEKQMMASMLARVRAGSAKKHEILGIVQAAYSPEHEARLGRALTRGFSSFTFVQMRIALRELRDEFHSEAEDREPTVEHLDRLEAEAAYFDRGN